MLLQSQSLHQCKVPLIAFHLLRNLFGTSLSCFNQHHCFPLDGRTPLRSQTRSHVSLMITFLESHLGQNSLGKNDSINWLSPAGLLSSSPNIHRCNCFCQLSITFYYQIRCSQFTPTDMNFSFFWLCWVFIAAQAFLQLR